MNPAGILATLYSKRIFHNYIPVIMKHVIMKHVKTYY